MNEIMTVVLQGVKAVDKIWTMGAMTIALGVSQVAMLSAIAAETVYKVRLRDVATGNANQASVFSKGDLDRQEWVVITVTNGKQVKVMHQTSVKNKFWGTRQWFDHRATSIRICETDGFDKTNCQTAEGDTIAMPSGKAIHQVSIDFKYDEGGSLYTRSIQLSKDIKPETPAAE
jgi:hypothetical protein